MSERDHKLIKMPGERAPERTVVLADGSYPSAPLPCAILAVAERVVCCDGATAEFVARGGMPYAIAGDCDSIPPELRERFRDILHCDPDQESNDLTKAVRLCLSKGLGEITILGATGKREDHSLGNIGLLADYAAMPGVRSVCMVTDHGVFDVISGEAWFESREGQQASIFTPDPASRVTTHNLLYPLREASLHAWWRGTLNQSLGDSFGFTVDGTAIVFRMF